MSPWCTEPTKMKGGTERNQFIDHRRRSEQTSLGVTLTWYSASREMFRKAPRTAHSNSAGVMISLLLSFCITSQAKETSPRWKNLDYEKQAQRLRTRAMMLNFWSMSSCVCPTGRRVKYTWFQWRQYQHAGFCLTVGSEPQRHTVLHIFCWHNQQRNFSMVWFTLSVAPSTWRYRVRFRGILPSSTNFLIVFQIHEIVRFAPYGIHGNTRWRCSCCLKSSGMKDMTCMNTKNGVY